MKDFFMSMIYTIGVIFFLVIFIISLVGCEAKSVGIEPSNNAEVNVERLFDIEGCRVYRFFDAGRSRYFANCGNITTTSSSFSCGKNRTCDEQIEVAR